MGKAPKARVQGPRVKRGQITPQLETGLNTPSARIRAQRDFLNRLDEPFRRGATEAYRRRSLKAQRKLKALELKFRNIIKSYPSELPTRAYNEATQIFDEAYEVATKEFDSANVWKYVYKDKAASRIIQKGVDAGIVQFDDPLWAQKGHAPRILDRNGEFRPLNIDHKLPRERNPFRALDSSNLSPVTEEANHMRSLESKHQPFEMGDSRARMSSDEIENFVQKHQISRRQRGERVPPREGWDGVEPVPRRGRGAVAPDSPSSGRAAAVNRATGDALEGTARPRPVPDLPNGAKVAGAIDTARPNAASFTRRGGLRNAARILGEVSDVVAPDPLDLATRPLNLGFISSLVIGLTVGLMMFVFERRLAKANAEGIAREYASKVYRGMTQEDGNRTLEQLVVETVQLVQTDAGDFEGLDKKKLFRSYIYAVYDYDILMELQAKDFSDVVIFFLRGLDFAEVYEDVEPQGKVRTEVYRAPLSEGRIFSQKRRPVEKNNIVRYRCRHRMLLWDPRVYQLYIDLWNHHARCRRALKDALSRHAGETRKQLEQHGRRLAEMIVEFRFLDAVNYLEGEHPQLDRTGKPSDAVRRALDQLMKHAIAGDKVTKSATKLQEDRKTLLQMYAGRNVFEDRKAAKKRRRAYKTKHDPTTFVPQRFPGSHSILF